MRTRNFIFQVASLLLTLSASLTYAWGDVISTCDQAGLQAALSSGGNFIFNCDGNITLTNTLTVSNYVRLDGNGHNVVIDGNNLVRLFRVLPGGALQLSHLTLANGKYLGTNGASGASGTVAQAGENASGGAILIQGGSLDLSSCVLSNNSVIAGSGGNYTSFEAIGAGVGGHGQGGAVCVLTGTFNATDCLFAQNWAVGSTGGWNSKDANFAATGNTLGGAICSFGGNIRLTNDVFVSNLSTGSVSKVNVSDGPAGNAFGGGLHADGGMVYLVNCRFMSNVARGGVSFQNGAAGFGKGGAISLSNSVVLGLRSRFETNAAEGAARRSGPTVGHGGAIFNAGFGDFRDSTFQGNQSQGAGAAKVGADGAGGAVYNILSASFDRCLFLGNKAVGGDGVGFQGTSAAGGNGLGGGMFNLGNLSMTNCALIRNTAQGKTGTPNFLNALGPGGAGKGGAIYNAGGTTTLMNVTISTNYVLGGKGNPIGNESGGGIHVTNGVVSLLNTIVANHPTGSNCFGYLIDHGYNLSSDFSCNFTNIGSLNNIDPMLGPLQDNGGPTLTIGLTDCSPALEAGSPTVLAAMDQRGIMRPLGSRGDIGACEGIVTWYHTDFTFTQDTATLKIFGQPNQTFTLSVGTNLSTWVPVLTNTLGGDCNFQFTTTNQSHAFFKVVYK